MAILTSLYTGISGINSNGASLSVIGDNIANMNTSGFKASKANFGDILSSSFTGGAGASQIGRGSFLSSVSPQFAQGSFETTANGLDLAIDGSGFLILEASDGTRNYSRAGAMKLDSNGYIVNPSGLSLLGYQYDATGTNTGVIDRINIASLSSPPSATTNVELTANLDSRSGGDRIVVTAGLNDLIVTSAGNITIPAGTYTGSTLISAINAAAPAGITATFDSTSNRFTFTNGTAGAVTFDWTTSTAAASLGFDTTAAAVIAAAGTDTSDAAAPFYKPPFDPNAPSSTSDFSSSITVYDSLGNGHQITTYFRLNNIGATGNEWEWFAVIPASEATSGVNTIGAAGTVSFSTAGAFAGTTVTTPADFDFSGGATQSQAITIDLDNLTQYGSNSATIFQNQDGFGSGSIQSVSINQEGIITGVFTNGQTRGVGQVALARFIAPEGLTKQGGNLFTESFDSGPPIVGQPGSSGMGNILSSTLELSNVDLANEFVAMISAQRGFQANSRVVSATDEILNELVNLRR